jgi:hypothetical protein
MTTQAMAALPVRAVRDGLLALGALLCASLVLALMRRAAIARWGLWAAFAVGVVLSTAGLRAASLRQLVLLLLIASSALGFRFGARR